MNPDMNSRPERDSLAALTFTLIPMIGGVMLGNLLMWMQVLSPKLGSFGGDGRFVFGAVVLATAAGVVGGGIGTYRFIRTGVLRQTGVWLLLAAGCITGHLSHLTLNVLPLSVSLDFRLASAAIGVNSVGVVLLVVYWWIL